MLSTAQHSTAQHSTAQHSTAQHSTARLNLSLNFLLRAVIVSTALPILSISTAQAADGCKFLLCMAAPNPTGISECVGTVKEVLRDLRKGKGLPTCSLVSSPIAGKTGSSHVSYRRAPLTPSCPAGTIQGQVGVIYHQGRKPDNITIRSKITGGASTDKQVIFVGKSERRIETDDFVRRACVGGKDYGEFITGGYFTRVDDSSQYVPKQVHHWYEKVVIMTPDGADYEFDVTIDGKPHSRHRFSF